MIFIVSAMGAGVLLSLLTYDKADACVKAWKRSTAKKLDRR